MCDIFPSELLRSVKEMVWRGEWKGRRGESGASAFAGSPPKWWADINAAIKKQQGQVWSQASGSLRTTFLQVGVEIQTSVTAVEGPFGFLDFD